MNNLPKSKKIILGVVLLFILGVMLPVAFVAKAAAQENPSLGSNRNVTLTPPTVTVNMDPGSTNEGKVTLINDSSDTLNLHIDTQDFIVTDKTGIPTLLPPNTYATKYSASAWVGVTPSTFSLPPHEKAEMTYYIQVPKDARPGGHYTALIFKPALSPGTAQTGAAIQTEIGTLFSIHVNGTIVENALVTQFLAQKFQEYGPVRLTTEIQNNGDSDITPIGTITFYDMFGNKVGAEYINADSHRIFPGASRDFGNTFGYHWMLGRYTARLLASYGKNNNLPLYAEVTFIVFPWKVTILIILILIAIVLGVLLWKRRKNNLPPTNKSEEVASTTPNLPNNPNIPSS